MIRSSKPSSLVCPLATICGSKLPLRSRGIASSIAPSSTSTVLLEWPLRLLPLPRPARSPFSYPRCSLSSAPSARSSSFFLSSLKSPSSPSRSCGELYPCSSSSITSSLIARAMSVIPLLHRVHHGSNLHKISDTLSPFGATRRRTAPHPQFPRSRRTRLLLGFYALPSSPPTIGAKSLIHPDQRHARPVPQQYSAHPSQTTPSRRRGRARGV